ncbi:hypothetical protein P3W45_001638 [Vairimorpha bombi]|jgi:non-canonical purine NTP pyrophosphatase (RdgB/HAM1 family)
MDLYFVTSNKNKLEEVRVCLNKQIHQIDMEITEIQGTKEEIAFDKLRKACKLNLNKYVMIDDTSIEIEALNGFPGPYGKDFLKIGVECIENLVSKAGRQTVASCIIGLGIMKDNGEFVYKLFSGEVRGKIVPGKQGGCGFNNVFLPDGCNKVYGNMSVKEKSLVSHRGLAIKKMKEYIVKNRIFEMS